MLLYQKLLWIPSAVPCNSILGHRILPIEIDFDRPYHLWTLFLHEKIECPPELPFYPVHNKNGFIEDYSHDYKILNGKLYYYSRISKGNHWVLLEFKTEVSEFFRIEQY